MNKIVLVAAAAFMVSACAGPSPVADAPEPVKIASIDEFLAHQDYIRAGIQDGSYGDIRAEEIELVIERQAELRAVLAGVESVDDLSEEDKIRIWNAQNAINGVLTRSLADTPICRREAVLGSHRQRTVCLTPRQSEKLREDSRESLRYLQNGFMPRRG